ncbi:MAG TPA: hypothetical protein VMV83_11640, partial [Rectinemataceae bacterium]|nr:hypothetical protein [Rectinemataceae bacterium]
CWFWTGEREVATPLFPLSLSFPPASCYSRNREKNLIPEKRLRDSTPLNGLKPCLFGDFLSYVKHMLIHDQ